MLTDRQLEVLRFLVKYQRESEGLAPTVREIGAGCDMRNQSVQDALARLASRGFIRRLPHRARGIEILRYPDAEFYVFDSETKQLRPTAGTVGR